jgi:hypothetical protein
MKYQKVRWLHNSPNEPIWVFEEISDERYEQRKVEVFPDGSFGYADQTQESQGTRLAWEPVPSLADIALDPQFEPKEISQEEFENFWAAAQVKATPTPDES